MATLLYLGVSGAWAYYCYYCFGEALYPPGTTPAPADVWEQIKVSMAAMPLYSVLPAVTEFAVEQGWTLAYGR